MPFKVTVSPSRGVQFSIDHQSFDLHVTNDSDQDQMTRYRWYAKQLRIALKRLEGKRDK